MTISDATISDATISDATISDATISEATISEATIFSTATSKTATPSTATSDGPRRRGTGQSTTQSKTQPRTGRAAAHRRTSAPSSSHHEPVGRGTPIDVHLDRYSKVPLYHQLATSIEDAIRDGTLQPGDQLENEVALTRYGLSRPTVRHALDELARKGLVVRRRGSGTQVLDAKINRDNRLSSLYDDLVEAGRHPQTTILDSGDGPEDDAAAVALDLARCAEPVIWIRRLRFADSEPLAILTNHLPRRYGITPDELIARGLYECLRARGIATRLAHQQTAARLLEPVELDLLNEQAPTAAMTAVRTAYDDAGRFVELGRHLYRASRYSLDVSVVA